MEKMEDLRDLLRHQVHDLMSAEDQIIEAMPVMIDKAGNRQLKQALNQHLRITREQRKRLDKVLKLLGDAQEQQGGLFSRLFGEGHKCKGMEGLIEEGQKVMKEDMNPEVMDAAIIAAAQRIEHYEITGYGTARAFARELEMKEVEKLLEQTLNEEYAADDLLTEMAVGKLNVQAEKAGSKTTPASSSRRGGSPASRSGAGQSATAKASGRSASRSSKRGGSSASRSSKSSPSRSRSGAAKSAAGRSSASKSSKAAASKSSSGAAKSSRSAASRKASKSSRTRTGGRSGSR